MKKITYEPIGIIRTPFTEAEGMPIQTKFSDAEGSVVLPLKFMNGLKGIVDFSHIILIYHFHKAKDAELLVKPFLSEEILGLFSIRAPNRPNPIGISVVELLDIVSFKNEVKLEVKGVDMLDETPLLDIKPYFQEFDCFRNARSGWYEKRSKKRTKSDGRFTKKD
ncbi:MAG: tRNA (N6-threonylcarbamoyladenosine(37)-N6)-methyltransferase TrmO [Asgard group archaeon]|nr:tRNA (N6-threonylcarbamoyladenosine(37)-N6)-methyltransferase TrmO [Asgard group archaeon]